MSLWRISPSMDGKHPLRTRLRRQEGASLIEFAFSLGIFLAVTVGIMVLCMALFTYEYVDFAAREAVRWAAVRGSDCSLSSSMPGCDAQQPDILAYVQGLNYPLIKPNSVQLTATWYQASTTVPINWSVCSDTCNAPGNQVKITITYPFSIGIAIPFVGSFTPTVSSTSSMVISQ